MIEKESARRRRGGSANAVYAQRVMRCCLFTLSLAIDEDAMRRVVIAMSMSAR